MNNFFEELEKYFEITSQNKINEDWSKYDTKLNNIGPSMEEFLFNCNKYELNSNFPIDTGFTNFNLNDLSPKFTSGFLIKQ